LLSLEAERCSYAVNRWLTYRQALELGGQVRGGEHGTTVVFWKLRRIGVSAESYPQEDEETRRRTRSIRCFAPTPSSTSRKWTACPTPAWRRRHPRGRRRRRAKSCC
jgi:antirestriction factor ArdC-like protein